MRDENLKITYRHGRPLAAYYSFAVRGRARSHRTREMGPGLLVDFTRSGRPIGVEILDPKKDVAGGAEPHHASARPPGAEAGRRPTAPRGLIRSSGAGACGSTRSTGHPGSVRASQASRLRACPVEETGR